MKKQLTIRLFRFGKKHQPFYRLGVSLGHTHPSRGAAKEFVGTYDPTTKILKVDQERVAYYLGLNTALSETVKSIFTKNLIIK
jgi:ribosomal protein S16